jgi:hypothetical protein
VAGAATAGRVCKQQRFSASGWGSGVALVTGVAALTFAIRGHELPLAPFVASASKIASGQIWVLATSALVVDKPVLIGLTAFAVLAAAALRVCGTQTFWLAAAAGHAGSTLLAYTIIGATRLADPHVFTRAVTTPDFGVSAMQGAWVGAIAMTSWKRAGTNRRNRGLVAAGVCAIAGVGWWLHPDPSILSTEHLFAFLIGCAIASRQQLTAAAARARRRLVPGGHSAAQHA